VPTKFGDAAYDWMRKRKLTAVTSNELWTGLEETFPTLTAKSATRKTPRTTFGRDLKHDPRFKVENRIVTLLK
jgi:hypothetical protein